MSEPEYTIEIGFNPGDRCPKMNVRRPLKVFVKTKKDFSGFEADWLTGVIKERSRIEYTPYEVFFKGMKDHVFKVWELIPRCPGRLKEDHLPGKSIPGKTYYFTNDKGERRVLFMEGLEIPFGLRCDHCGETFFRKTP